MTSQCRTITPSGIALLSHSSARRAAPHRVCLHLALRWTKSTIGARLTVEHPRIVALVLSSHVAMEHEDGTPPGMSLRSGLDITIFAELISRMELCSGPQTDRRVKNQD